MSTRLRSILSIAIAFALGTSGTIAPVAIATGVRDSTRPKLSATKTLTLTVSENLRGARWT